MTASTAPQGPGPDGARPDGAAPGDAATDDVRDLAARAAATDGVEPLSEAFLLALGDDDQGVEHHPRHLDDGTLVGYAQRRPDGSAELVVDPEHRRRGHGRALVGELTAADPSVRIWAHGDLPAARALAVAVGLAPVRSLHVMGRPLNADDLADHALPEGFSVRPFQPGHDEDAWVAINAAAFAQHPEQGALTRRDLEARMALPWFDADGLLMVEATEPPLGAPSLAAFHWTKREPGGDAGEVYVLGVHPAYQGRGLAGPLTALGLAHLARHGATSVHLYVDGDNAPALATYRRAGFSDLFVDVMYAAGAASATR